MLVDLKPIIAAVDRLATALEKVAAAIVAMTQGGPGGNLS